jgi:hypothetical protein
MEELLRTPGLPVKLVAIKSDNRIEANSDLYERRQLPEIVQKKMSGARPLTIGYIFVQGENRLGFGLLVARVQSLESPAKAPVESCPCELGPQNRQPPLIY